jgi:SET domain
MGECRFWSDEKGVGRPLPSSFSDSEKIIDYLTNQFVNNVKIFEEKTGKSLLPQSDKFVLQKLFGIIELNSMTINLVNGLDLNGLYPVAGTLEHSCMPNCFYTFDNCNGFKISVRAAREVKKGETLTAMSTQMLWDTASRREHLLATKYFSCKCQRCADPTELGTYFSGM